MSSIVNVLGSLSKYLSTTDRPEDNQPGVESGARETAAVPSAAVAGVATPTQTVAPAPTGGGYMLIAITPEQATLRLLNSQTPIMPANRFSTEQALIFAHVLQRTQTASAPTRGAVTSRVYTLSKTGMQSELSWLRGVLTMTVNTTAAADGTTPKMVGLHITRNDGTLCDILANQAELQQLGW